MNRNIKAEYDGKHFTLTAEECNTVELLSLWLATIQSYSVR